MATLQRVFTLAACMTFALSTGASAQHVTDRAVGDAAVAAPRFETPAARTLTTVEWQAYGERLAQALESDNEGVRRGALRLIGLYGERLQLGREATYQAVRIYRSDADPLTRQMAVIAVGRINHPWGIDFLRRSVDGEPSPQVARSIRSTLAEHALVTGR